MTSPELIEQSTAPEVDKKAALLAGRGAGQQRHIPVPAFGFDVTVRGLTRSEAHRVVGKEMSEEVAERRLLAMGLVDPLMTEEDVRRWQKVAPAGELKPVVDAVMEMSGMAQEVVSQGIQQFRE